MIRRRPVSSRAVLLLGFGGLLLLMVLAEIGGVRALRQIQTENDDINGDFLRRTQVLERLRADIFVSGTSIRDFLLDPSVGKVDESRTGLQATRGRIDAELNEYKRLLRPEEQELFDVLNREWADYTAVLERALSWTPAERQRAGFAFVRDEVSSRRTSIVAAADRIGTMAVTRLGAEKLHVAESYRQYRGRLTIVIGSTIGLGLLLAAFSIRQILTLEQTTLDRLQEVTQAREESKELSSRLVAAQETERAAIARELHDEVGQSLTGVLLEMANLTNLIRREKNAPLETKVTEVKQLVEDCIGVVRNLALLLRPPMLDDLGLIPALQWQARETTKRSGIRVKIAAEGIPETLPDELNTCIYRIVQEALHNAMQHSGAHTVRISVQLKDANMYVSIQDDGKGFSPKGGRGMGLLGMEERVSRMGGSFAIESEKGFGAILRVVLPVQS
jgi:signal transduction histidine kinase